jgi:hypothetical protein
MDTVKFLYVKRLKYKSRPFDGYPVPYQYQSQAYLNLVRRSSKQILLYNFYQYYVGYLVFRCFKEDFNILMGLI